MGELALELRQLGHEVTVLTTTPHYNADRAASERQPLTRGFAGLVYRSTFGGIAVWHVALPAKGQRVWVRALDFIRFHILSLAVSLFALGRQDVVIATSPPLTIGIVSWLIAGRLGAKSVYKVAELYPDLAIRQGVVRNRGLIRAMTWVERVVYARNSRIVPIGRDFADIIRSRGVPETKLTTIPDFVDTDLYRPLPRDNDFSRTHGLSDKFVVLYAGNIGLVQDWPSVLFAAEQLRDLPVTFLVVGDGALREWLKHQIAERRLDNMRLLEYQPRAMMPLINASCDIAIIPLTQAGAREGLPSKIYSTLACARPAIVSANGSSELASIVASARCGRIVPPDDKQAFASAVRQAYSDRALLPEEGARGRGFVERDYAKEAIARRYDLLIQEICSPAS